MKTKDLKIEDFDLVDTDGGYTFDNEDMFRWAATSRKAYEKIERLIGKISYKGAKWRIYAWDDVSGFDYWMLKQREMNYVQLTVYIESHFVSQPTIDKINKSIKKALDKIEVILKDQDELPDED